ncbi:hypothetical protein F5Y13DRAFT_108790 [Hypoxylon sp. FL1857]|nr:hypothetical protein F5Y13DRAFT_108790 [Hypoxylon sp. FL1857]
MDIVAAEASSWRESPSPGSETQEKYQCPRCPSNFKRPEHLKRHQRSHDGHKPFMCSICLKRFFRSDILTRHELMHLAAQRTSHTLNRKRACTECARARERCSRDEPCLRCSSKSLQCLYPDDATQKTHNEPSTSSRDERGHLEEHAQLASHHHSILPKQEGYMTSNPLHRQSFNEDDPPFRDFLHALRNPTTSSFIPDPDRSSSNLLYKSTAFPQEPLSRLGGEPSGFEAPKTLDAAGRQVPLFDQPAGSSFNRARIHDAIGLDDPRFGQASLGDYANLAAAAAAAPTDPPSLAPSPFDFHSEAMSASSTSEPRAGGSGVGGEAVDPFLAMHKQGAGRLGSVGDDEGFASTVASAVASQASGRAPHGMLTLSDFGSRPINLKAYELIASQFKELCLEHGNGESSACSNNISESQRTAQHELLVKLYYEHFKQQAY